jgi:hypothetical protein
MHCMLWQAKCDDTVTRVASLITTILLLPLQNNHIDIIGHDMIRVTRYFFN